jgi:hypothetical protein
MSTTMIVLAVVIYILLWNFVFQFWGLQIPEIEGDVFCGFSICVFLPFFFLLMLLVFFGELGEKFGKFVRDFNN